MLGESPFWDLGAAFRQSSVCSSSGLGTHWSRWESSWKALLWGSSMSRPYRAFIRYGLFFTSSSCRRRSAVGQKSRVGVLALR